MSDTLPNPGDNYPKQISSIKEGVSLRELHDLFIKYKYHGAYNAQQTIKSYQNNFKLLLEFKPNLKLEDLTEETLILFLEFLNTRKRTVGKQKIIRSYKNSSMAIVRSKLNSFFVWLVERQYIPSNPFANIPYPKISYTDRRAFSPREFESICFAVNTKIKWANLYVKKRNIAIIMTLVLTGMRKEELISLQMSDVDIVRGFINVRSETSKSKRARFIPLNPQLKPYLEDYLYFRKQFNTQCFWVSSTRDRGFTEHGVKHLMTLISQVTGINCHLHRFRHTFAVNYYKQTHDIVGLQRVMGHKSLKMTLSYLRSIPDEYVVEQMRKISIDEFV
jgi:site-specific recombinase XerD